MFASLKQIVRSIHSWLPQQPNEFAFAFQHSRLLPPALSALIFGVPPGDDTAGDVDDVDGLFCPITKQHRSMLIVKWIQATKQSAIHPTFLSANRLHVNHLT